MKYYATGERIDYDGVTLLVTPTQYNNAVCTGCWFSDWERRKRGEAKMSCCTHGIACTKNKRKDKRHVVFIKVNK